MWKQLAISIFVFVVGCTAITPPRFDPIEFDYYVILAVDAQKVKNEDCDDPKAVKNHFLPIMKEITSRLVVYTQYKRNDNDSHNIAKELDKMIDEITNRYEASEPPSAQYCTIKMDLISTGAKRALTAIGKEK